MKIGHIARWYRWIEYAAFGKALERCRFAFLPRLAAAQNVLMLGEGDGRFLARLLALAPTARFDVMEISPEMIKLAKQRTGNSERVRFFCQNAAARTTPWPRARYDTVVSLFFLDCFTEDDARTLIPRLATILTPGGLWLISEFAIPPHGWRRFHAQVWISAMYLFFRTATGLRARQLPPIESIMREAGMRRVAQEQARAGMMVSEVWLRRD